MTACFLCAVGSDPRTCCIVQELHAGMAAIRRAAARTAAREAAAEGSTCSLCMEHPQGVVFGCGHQVLSTCIYGAPQLIETPRP
jgi:hypothetical protein